jgi:hypothetical protein
LGHLLTLGKASVAVAFRLRPPKSGGLSDAEEKS